MVMTMIALYLENAGRNCLEVVELLMRECDGAFVVVKMVLAGCPVRLPVEIGVKTQELKEKLEELGARVIIEVSDDGNVDDLQPDVKIGPVREEAWHCESLPSK